MLLPAGLVSGCAGRCGSGGGRRRRSGVRRHLCRPLQAAKALPLPAVSALSRLRSLIMQETALGSAIAGGRATANEGAIPHLSLWTLRLLPQTDATHPVHVAVTPVTSIAMERNEHRALATCRVFAVT